MTDLLDKQTQNRNWLIQKDLKYDTNNFWVNVDGKIAYIGLTDYGQWTIGDVLYLDLEPEGTAIVKGQKFGSIESGKWVGNLLSPVDGVIEKNNALVLANPQQINIDPYGAGWIIRAELESEKAAESLLDYMVYALWVEKQVERDSLQYGEMATH
jgi:glycine cleavage system H protein